MIFESFLQNYIKNFEEQETNNSLMGRKKLGRIFSSWKSLQPPKKGRTTTKLHADSKTTVKSKPMKVIETVKSSSESTSLNPMLEQEYMVLVTEFRRVTSNNIVEDSAQSATRMETRSLQKSYWEKKVNC